MGLDMTYMAVPHDLRSIEAAVGKSMTGEYLKIHGFERDAEHGPAMKDRRMLHTGIKDRQLYIERRWDMLYYLISENRRNNAPIDESNWAYRAIHGGKKLGDDICLPQGVPIYYLPPKEVLEIWRHLEEISKASLRKYWDPAKMYEAGVYKIHPVEHDSQFEILYEDFENLKNLYLFAAIYHEGVLTLCD